MKSTEAPGGGVRIVVPAAQAAILEENDLFEVMGEVPFSSTTDGASGDVFVWVALRDAEAAAAAIRAAGVSRFSTFEEVPRDWVLESARLRKAVAMGRYLLDPHDGELAADPAGRRRLWLPAAQAFGTGSHESTRLALRLLLLEPLAGARVLDVGCGTGTLAFVASLEGAAAAVAFDQDPDSAVATRQQGRANGIPNLAVFCGTLDAVAPAPRFDVVVANLLRSEISPLLPRIRLRLKPRGRLITSGQLVEERVRWESQLESEGFRAVRVMLENEWLGMTSVSSNG